MFHISLSSTTVYVQVSCVCVALNSRKLLGKNLQIVILAEKSGLVDLYLRRINTIFFFLRGSTCRDRLVVRTLRCGRSNPGSNPGHGSDMSFIIFNNNQFDHQKLHESYYFVPFCKIGKFFVSFKLGKLENACSFYPKLLKCLKLKV